MSEDFERVRTKLLKDMAGDGPIQKQIILLKLTDLFEKPPDLTYASYKAGTPERHWLSAVGALLNRIDRLRYGIKFDSTVTLIGKHPDWAVDSIRILVGDVIEGIKLELDLDGRSEIGNAYAPGEYYKYFRDLKQIIAGAAQQVFVIDPYFDGKAFDAYLSDVHAHIEVSILADRYSKDAKAYAERHVKQYGSRIELRRSAELHDRLIFIDGVDCWITGGSVKDGGKDATYLIPTPPEIAQKKQNIYLEIWGQANLLA